VPDSYLSIAAIASDPYMSERVRACAAQQSELGSVDIDEPIAWTASERYVWAASPGWGEGSRWRRASRWDLRVSS
jgi:hypothetical protein